MKTLEGIKNPCSQKLSTKLRNIVFVSWSINYLYFTRIILFVHLLQIHEFFDLVNNFLKQFLI